MTQTSENTPLGNRYILSPEAIALRLKIRDMWEVKGWSAGVIGRHLGVTRNVVIGHINRMKLAPKTFLGKKLPPGGCIHPKTKPTPPPEPPIEPEVNIVPLHIGMMELSRGMCNWPYGDAEFTFCGLAAEGLYCPAHKRKAFQPGTQPRGHRDKMRSDRQFGF